MSPSTERPLTGLIAALLLAPAPATAQRPIAGGQRPPITTLTAFTPPVGPPPPNAGWDASATIGVIAKLVWGAAPNAVSYAVRRRLQEDAACCNATSPTLPASATSWTDTGLHKKGTYIFTILVTYADGSLGSRDVYIAAKGIQNPVLTAETTTPGRVKLTFDNNIPGTSMFMIGGPGMGTGRMVSSGPVETGGLPPGEHTWTAASIYAQGLGILSPASEWSRVTHPVSYGSGRFRISLEGFKALNVTAEDPFRADGRGDEIFITTQVNEYRPEATLVAARTVRTPTFGDVQNFPTRVRAGSASGTGGIMPNDQYPAPVEHTSQVRPATLGNLPYLLWEGDLNEINGLVMLSPAIWESDEDDQLFPYFSAFHARAASNVPYRNQFMYYQPDHGFIGQTRQILDMWHPQKSCPVPLGNGAPTMFVPPISGWRDEPIDMNVDRSYCPMWVAINWKVANSLTRVNPAQIVEIPFTNPATKWDYTLYVRIEKVAPAAPTMPVRTMRRVP